MSTDVSAPVKRMNLGAAILMSVLLLATVANADQAIFSVSVNYVQSLDAMIQAGRYNLVHPDLTRDHFPMTLGPHDVTIELVHFDRVMTSDEVLIELDRRGLRPATLPELLAFGAKYPEKQREFPVVALGSFWRRQDDHREVPYLWGDADGRGLNLDWLGDGWGAHCRFAAVRK